MFRNLDLKKYCGLPFEYDGKQILFSEFKVTQKVDTTIDDLKSQLLNDEINSSEVYATKYIQIDNDDLFANKGFRYNLYVVNPLLAGVEYAKTKAVKIKQHPKILEVVSGGGIIALQRNNQEQIKDLIVSKVKRGDKIVVPANYAISLINTRQNPFIVGEIYCSEARHTYVLDDMGGMAYYVIKKNGKQETVKNSFYKEAPKARNIKWEEVNKRLNITSKTPIIKQVLRKYEKFSWIFKTDSFKLD